MGLKVYDIDPADTDADGLADGNDSSVTSITIDGALASGGSFTSADGLAHRLIITDAGGHDQRTATYTITGTNSNGDALTESLAGPNSSSSVETTEYFLTVTSITIASPTASSTVDIGTVDEFMSPVYLLNWRSSEAATVAILGSSGTYQVDIQETFGDIYNDGIAATNWVDKHADKSADLAGSLTLFATAVRVKSDSYTNGAEFQFHINQLEYS